MFSFARGILSNVRQSGLAFALLSVRTYKVRSALKLKCPGCKFVRRKGRLRVICKNKNTHKQKQGWWLYFGYLWSQLLSSIIHGIFSRPFKVICVSGFMTEYNGQWCCFVLTDSLLYDHWKEKIFFCLGERKPHTVVTVCDLVLVNLHFHYLLVWQFYCLPHVEAVECGLFKNEPK